MKKLFIILMVVILFLPPLPSFGEESTTPQFVYAIIFDFSTGFTGMEPLVGPHTFAFRWATTTPSKTIVRYGRTIYPDNRIEEQAFTTQHTVYAEGLTANTDYVLIVETEGQNGTKGKPVGFLFTTKSDGNSEAPRLPILTEGTKTGSVSTTIDTTGAESASFVDQSRFLYQKMMVQMPRFNAITQESSGGLKTRLTLDSTISDGELPYAVSYGASADALLFKSKASTIRTALLPGVDSSRPYAFRIATTQYFGMSLPLIKAKTRPIASSEFSSGSLSHIDPPELTALKAVKEESAYKLFFDATTPVTLDWSYKVINRKEAMRTVSTSALQQNQAIELTGLESEQRYWTQLRMTDQWGNETEYDIQFKTLPRGTKAETIVDLKHSIGTPYSFYETPLGSYDENKGYSNTEIEFYGSEAYKECSLTPRPDSFAQSFSGSSKPPYDYSHGFTFKPTAERYTILCMKNNGARVSQTFEYPRNTKKAVSSVSSQQSSGESAVANPAEQKAQTAYPNYQTEIVIPPSFRGSDTTLQRSAIAERLKGRILLQVQRSGEAWYVNPNDGRRYFLGRPGDAFALMRRFGIGITNNDLRRIPVADTNLSGTPDSDNDGLSDEVEESFGINALNADTDRDGYSDREEMLSGYDPFNAGNYFVSDYSFARKQAGKMLLQVEFRGQAWYVNPSDNKRYYLGRPADAFAVMRKLGLGIADNDLAEIAIGQ